MTVAMAEEKEAKEGNNLLGSPTFTKLENGRFKCVETGHELLSKDKDSYSRSKRCRLGLIDFALSNNKPPLNMFKQDPSSRSKLVCKLTGDVVNKSEEHIWKHINGKRFLNKLEQKETGNFDEKVEEEAKLAMEGKEKEKKKNKKKKNNKKLKDENSAEGIVSDGENCSEKDGDLGAEEVEFWMPPVGERWDFDDGGDRWGSDEDSGDENEEENEAGDIAEENGSEDLSKRTKRKSTEMGSSSFASRKKKKKKKKSKKNPKS